MGGILLGSELNLQYSLSKYNIFSKLSDSPDYFIVNLLSGHADILDAGKAKEIAGGDFTGFDEYVEKGYLVKEKEENKRFKLKYLDFLNERDNDEIQLFFVPRYSCNFSCSYCYQSRYYSSGEDLKDLSKETVDAFYRYIDKEFAGRRKYITVFGGEPLLDGEKAREQFRWIIDGAAQRHLDVAVVTNGYYLTRYMDILQTAKIREIQVTLDGTRDIHDQRRQLHNGQPTFDRIVAGIDRALENDFPINLRVVVDKENIDNLMELAEFAIKKKWTANPLFKTQLGRNYELHSCQPNREKLFTRLSLYEAIYKLVKKHPGFLEFHGPAFSISRFLFDNGELPDPLFDSCPGTKTEWAFDYTGQIYACTATVGKKGEELGTFYPKITKNEEAIETWEDRDVTSIPECRACELQLACGGGCASAAKNKTGQINSPDCRPVKELLEMGISLYFGESKKSDDSDGK